MGRAPKLAAVERGLAAVDDGLPAILGVSGQPGIGKSRLVAELAERAALRGARVLTGRAVELERDLPFALLVDALDAPMAAHAEPEELAELAGVLPAFGRAVGVAPAHGHGERHRTARATRALLEALCAYEPSRRPRAENIARQSRRMSGLAHQRNPAVVALRNIAMRAAPVKATLRQLDDLVGRPAGSPATT